MTEKRKKTNEPKRQGAGNNFEKRYLNYLIIGAFAFVLYANSIGNDYNMDDQLVTNKHKLTSLGFKGIPQIISSPYYSDAQGYAYDYRPIVHISFAIENQLFGDNPHVGHFFNVLLYILCCLLLYRLLRKLLPVADWVCVAGVLVFAAHPVHTEVVCSLKNRDELLAMLFAFWAFDVYLRFYESTKWYFLTVGFLLISLSFLSKLSSASYATLIPVALLLFKGHGKQASLRAVSIVVVTALSAVLIQPSVTLGNKFNTFLLLVLPVLLVILIQHFNQTVVGLKSLQFNWRSINRLNAWHNRKKDAPETKAPVAPKVSDTGTVVSFFLFKNYAPTTNWLSWKPWALNLFLLALGVLPFLFGSLLASFAMMGILMISFLLGTGLHKWLSFCVLGIYIIVLFSIFPVLAHYFFPFTAMFFIAFMLHPQKQYSVAATLLFASIFGASLVFGEESQYKSFLILAGWGLVRTKYGKIVAGSVAFILLVIIINSLSHFLLVNVHASVNPYLIIERTVFAVLVITGIYMAYKRIDFSRYVQVLFVLIIATLIGNTSMNQSDNGRRLLGHPFLFSMLYYNNSEAALQLGKAVRQAPATLVNTGNKLRNAQKKVSEVRARVAESKVEVFTVPTDRPLLYLEAPVGVTDPIGLRIGTSLAVLLHYAKLMLVPYPLSFYYGYKVIEPTPLSDWKAIVSFVLYLFLLLLAFWNIKRNRILALGLFGYLLGIVLFANFNNLIPGVVGDRYLLFPSVGFCIIIIAAIQLYAERKKIGNHVSFTLLPPVLKYGVGTLLLLLSIETFSRNLDWKDKITLYRHDMKNVSQSAQAHNLLALEIMKNSTEVQNAAQQTQMRQEAVEEFKASIKIYPPFFNAIYDAGRVFMLLNMPDSAVAYFERAIPLNPDFTQTHQNIAQIYMQQGKWQQAIPYLETAIKAHPKDYSAYDKLSYVYFMLKDFDNSIKVNRAAIAEMPENAEPLINLGRTFQGMQKADSARYYLKKSDAMAPGNRLVQEILKSLGN